MKRSILIVFIIALFVSTNVALAQTSDPKAAMETFSSGLVNWTTNEVIATGIGAPPTAPMNPAQARAMTERAAYVVALRNLLETVKGIQVDSETVVENYIVKSDVIKTRVQGIVNSARVINTRYLSDGSVEVQVAMSLKGAFMDTLVPERFGRPLILPPISKPAPVTPKPSDVKPTPAPTQPPVLPSPTEKPKEPPKPVTKPTPSTPSTSVEKPSEPAKPIVPPAPPTPEKKPEPAKPTPPPVVTAPEKKPEPALPATTPETGSTIAFKGGMATGVVIDGRGLGLRPALLPKLVDTQGNEIYVGQIVTRTNAVEQGVAGYAKDVNAAANNFRVTDNPAVIKGLRAAGATRTDIVLSQVDAQALRQLGVKGDFLQNCRVIIVY